MYAEPTVLNVTRETGPQGTWEISTIDHPRGYRDTVAFKINPTTGEREEQAYPYHSHGEAQRALRAGTLRKMVGCADDDCECEHGTHPYVYPVELRKLSA